MGTWDEGILDNDSALDGLGDLSHSVTQDILRFAGEGAAIGKVAGAVGVLMQLSAYDFRLDATFGRAIASALEARRSDFEALPSAARDILEGVAAGRGQELAETPAEMPLELVRSLHTNADKAPFGRREPALFDSSDARAYTRRIAIRCMNAVRADFREADNWSDLCREASGIGPLAFLLVLEPCSVPARVVERWRRKARKGLARLEKEPDDELDFQRKYYANLDTVFGALLRRFGAEGGAA